MVPIRNSQELELMRKSGKITALALKKVINSQDAELQAIGNALHVILNSEMKDIKHIYINTDCKHGIEAVTKGKKMNSTLETVKFIQSTISKLISN